SVSIVAEKPDLFSSGAGIYYNSTASGIAWERSGSLEWINPDGSRGFQVNCGLRMHGGNGRTPSVKKHNFRVLFKTAYGPSKLDYPVFDEHEGASDSFDSLIFRARYNNSWHHWSGTQRNQAMFLRDEFMRRSGLAIGSPNSHGTYVHLYVDGLYWGLYNLVERPNADFAETYFGGDKDSWDMLNSGEAIDGNTAAWSTAMGIANSGTVTNRAGYESLAAWIDVTNHMDYCIYNFYGGNQDWRTHNWYAGRLRQSNETFKFFSWDAERTLESISGHNETGININNAPSRYYNAFRQVPEYRLMFADRAHCHLFNDGALTPSNSLARLQTLIDIVDGPIVAESARWGDMRRDPPYERNNEWVAERDRLINNYIPQRTANVIAQLRAASPRMYPLVDAPVFNKHGGKFDAGFNLSISSASGVIYYTMDGSDPREAWTGAVQGNLYAGAIPLTNSVFVRARVLDGGTWSALNKALFILKQSSPLRISEVMFHAHAPSGSETNIASSSSDYDFIELVNTGSTVVGLADVAFTDGIQFNFIDGRVPFLGPGEHVVVVANWHAFTNRYTDWATMNIAGEYEGDLANGGEQVRLEVPGLLTNVTFNYNDSRGWPLSTQAGGHSLVPLVTDGQTNRWLDYAGNWRSSTYRGGSPGVADPPPFTNLVINEFAAHTDTVVPGYDSDDWIELFNVIGSDIFLTNWYLSDDITDLKKW
ncbi:MAG: CotH kinase family protein, partial [Verrucomicrobiota bacterium]